MFGRLAPDMADAPEEASLSKSCVVGMVCLGKVIQASKVENPWVCASLPLVPEIVAIEFRSPVRWEKGKQVVWHVKEGEMQGKLKEATASGIPCGQLQKMRDPLPSAKKHTSRWKSKKRKRRSDAGNNRQSGSSFLHSIQGVAGCFSAALCKAEVGKSTSIRSLAGQHKPAEGTRPLQSCPTGGSRKTLELLTTLMAKSHSCSPEEVSLLSGTISQCSF